MIPQDAALGVPGADDPAILADITKSVGPDLPLVRKALTAIARQVRAAPSPPWTATEGKP